MTDYTELKRLAEGAVHAGDHWGLRDSFERQLAKLVSPETILALIAENEQLRDGANMRAIRSLRGDCADLLAERDQLKAENEALRRERDARHPFKPFHEPAIGFTGCVICGVYADHGGLPCPKTRATADAAMGKGEQS